MSAAHAIVWLTLGAPHAGAAELRDTWEAYLRVYVSPEGRVIDFREDGVTTSEGQSYAMLRALWMNDQPAFDRVWSWTVANLQAGAAGRLPAWRWGLLPAGDWGVLDPQPAADADQLIIWSLLGATRRWKSKAYAAEASRLVERFWIEEVDEVGGRLVVLPGPWARGADPIRLNPSYFLPFVWRDLARWDKSRPWRRLLDDGYALLEECRGSTGLAKDWCWLNATTGAVVAAPVPEHDNYAFEALRVPWTLAAEVKWHHEPRARRLLGPYLALLATGKELRLPAVIGPDGGGRVEWEYPGMYGALLPAWGLRRPALARRVLAEKLEPLRGDHGWGDADDYYGQNWIWFGLALWQMKERPV